MPKEITHWIVADRLAQRLQGTPWAEPLRDYPSCLKLGAVFPDALYYPHGSRHPAIRAATDVLAGSGGADVYAILRALIHAIRSGGSNRWLAAWLAGVVSHLEADAVFHPLIFHLTGHYDHPDPVERTKAVQRHRALESLLDIHFCRGLENVKHHSLRRIMDASSVPLEEVYANSGLADLIDAPQKDIARAVRRAFSSFALVQGLGLRFWLGGTLHRLWPILPDPAREVAALFYSRRMAERTGLLDGEISYQNPVSGEKFRDTVENMLERAVNRSQALCRRLEDAVFRGGELTLEKGESFEGTDGGELKYFASQPLMVLG